MKNVPRVQMPGKANSRAYVEATHYDWLVHEMEVLRRKLDEALLERDAMGAERDRLAAELAQYRKWHDEYREQTLRGIAELQAELSAARADAERYRWLRDAASAGQWSYLEGCAGDALDEQVDKWRAALSAGAEHG